MRPIHEWCQRIHKWAHSKGFYFDRCDAPCRHISGSFASAVILIVTELAEAVEADRKGDLKNRREEIADATIRIFDLCGAEGIDLENEIALKMEVNEQRPTLHGKKY